MNILDTITAKKRLEVAENKELYPIKLLEKSKYFETKPVSMKKYILRTDKSGIIAEFKRKSPSKGTINEYVKVADVTLGYMQSGASALSILTDKIFFGGSSDDLTKARKINYCPILRKDFVVDEYQIIEAKSIGADAVLLIASILEKSEISKLTEFAKSLGLEVIFEIHSKSEIDKMPANVDIIGVNNRNLDTFTVNINNSLDLINYLPKEIVKISESGIHSSEIAFDLKKAGYNGLLIGEQFMKTADPVKACREFIEELTLISNGKSVNHA